MFLRSFWLIHILLLLDLAKHSDNNLRTARENFISRPEKSEERQVAARSQSKTLRENSVEAPGK